MGCVFSFPKTAGKVECPDCDVVKNLLNGKARQVAGRRVRLGRVHKATLVEEKPVKKKRKKRKLENAKEPVKKRKKTAKATKKKKITPVKKKKKSPPVVVLDSDSESEDGGYIIPRSAANDEKINDAFEVS